MIDKIRVKSAQVCQISTAKVNLMGVISGTTKKKHDMCILQILYTHYAL